jgi:hypothetical protein
MDSMRTPLVTAALLAAAALTGCNEMRQKEPPPSYTSTTLGVAQSISGVAADTPASAASAAAAGPAR